MADKSRFFDDALKGKPTHRLCIDFSSPGGIKNFLAKAKSSGILPSECEPLCIFAEGESSVWLDGKRRQPTILEVN